MLCNPKTCPAIAYSLQPSSSAPSSQSLFPLQTQRRGIHLPLLHLNCDCLQSDWLPAADVSANHNRSSFWIKRISVISRNAKDHCKRTCISNSSYKMNWWSLQQSVDGAIGTIYNSYIAWVSMLAISFTILLILWYAQKETIKTKQYGLKAHPNFDSRLPSEL